MTNVELVKQMYSDIATGNVAAALSVFDPAILWHECEGMPFVNDSGIYTGPEAVVKNVFMQLPVVYDGFNVEPSEIFGADDKVVMVGYYTGTNKATGRPFKANATHTWTVKDGKLIRFFQAVDTATLNT
jgi:ketosteroid isomerase-like protein